MRVLSASDPGDTSKANEDWFSASPRLIVVLDGATARTDTGCRHGVSWYAAKLGSVAGTLAADLETPLKEALKTAIEQVAEMHKECDLNHPGTPSAAVSILRINGSSWEYLVLGDISVIIDQQAGGAAVVTDTRVDSTARPERDEVDRHLIGSPEKQAALLRMKHAELAARNQPGGFWVATAIPSAADHAIVGSVPLDEVQRLAVLTDGAARIVDLFGALDWPAVLDNLSAHGPAELIRQVRTLEGADPQGARWPRNKRSDDATVVYAT
ncbi:protein phosphatase 2C domain-containing protein [Micromonospora sp. NBC_01412]|uniref:protein phosphatase 2C domain-containing protein n=1 Tax=Micromonospora sp. NBC_01412 TaxID=2903590 RepID=UPI003245B809